MHYAIRPWPWIIVALASLMVFPELDDISSAFPGIDEQYLAHDVAYPAMISKLGPGVLGIVIASIIAAYMSTIGTHLNWGSSYLVNDFYSRFVNKDASQKHLVAVGRIATVVLMIGAGIFALQLKSATQAFDLLLLSGAGTGSIYLLRWFWWRINAVTEIVAMVGAIVIGCILVFVVDPDSLALTFGGTEADPKVSLDGGTVRLLLAVGLNTIVWLTTTPCSPVPNRRRPSTPSTSRPDQVARDGPRSGRWRMRKISTLRATPRANPGNSPMRSSASSSAP